MSDQDDARTRMYQEALLQGLTTQCGSKIYLVDGFLACLGLACHFVAMMAPDARDQLCRVVEDDFRTDVEDMAKKPGGGLGAAKLQ